MKTKFLRPITSAVFFSLALGFAWLGGSGPCRAQATSEPGESVTDTKAADSTAAPALEVTSLPLTSDAGPEVTTPYTPPANLVAAPEAPSSSPAPASAATDQGDWHLMIAPYLWLPGVHGTIGGPNEQLGFSASPGDLLSHFRFGLMGVVEPSYKRVLLPLDIFWVRLADYRSIDNIPTPTVANLKAYEFILTQKVGYRLIDSKMVKVDALVGFRYWHFHQSVSFTTNTLNFSNSQDWVDPVVGGRITGNLSPKFMVTIAGDDGGWGTGSQQDYQVFGALGYRIKPALALQVGYRYLFVNYRSGIHFLNIATSGVLIGVSINLK